jgi:hypothetical protein
MLFSPCRSVGAAGEMQECLNHATAARKRADCESNAERRAKFVDMERRWLRLARSYQLTEMIDRFVLVSSK